MLSIGDFPSHVKTLILQIILPIYFCYFTVSEVPNEYVFCSKMEKWVYDGNGLEKIRVKLEKLLIGSLEQKTTR